MDRFDYESDFHDLLHRSLFYDGFQAFHGNFHYEERTKRQYKLLEACKYHYATTLSKAKILELIAAGAKVNITDNEGKTALFYAVEQSNNESVVRALIDGGADVNITDSKGKTALFYVVKQRRIQNFTKGGSISFSLFRQLIVTPRDILQELFPICFSKGLMHKGGFRETHGTPSGSATVKQRYNESVVCDLIHAGVDVNITDNEGKTALFYAVQQRNNESVVRALIDAGADVNTTDNDGKTALSYAVQQRNNESVVRVLIDAGADVDKIDNQGNTSLDQAWEHRNTLLALKLIDAGADIQLMKEVNMTDKEGKSLLIKAIESGKFSSAVVIIKGKADVNRTDNEGKTALFYAVQQINDESVVRALIDAGADVKITDNERKTALFYAVQNNNESMVRAMIDVGADVNITDHDGKTALFYAVQQRSNESVVRALIAAGADVNRTYDGKTALFIAVQKRNNESVIRALIDAGANVKITDNEGKTALFYAVQKKNEIVARVLIDAGADVDKKYFEGRTVLFNAAPNVTIARMLIEDGGALVKARDVYGRTPLFYAMNESLETASLLINKGAKVKVKDNCNVSILAFFIEHCLRKAHDISKGLNLLRENDIESKTIFETLVSMVFCSCFKLCISIRFGEFQMESLSGALEIAKCYIEKEDPRQRTTDKILTIMKKYNKEKCIYEKVVSKIITSLVDLGADPNTADSDGNTALHYATRLIFEEVPPETVKDICWNLKEVDASFNAKNHRRETPVLFGLSEKFLCDVEKRNTKWNLVFKHVYGILIENESSVDEIEKGGNSLFHLILILFQRVLYFDTKERKSEKILRKRKRVLGNVADLFQLCCQAITQTENVTINRRDANLNSPLHLWSNLKWIGLSPEEDWQHLRKIMNNLSKCGARLKERNKNDETPLHLCTTWRAAKLLLEEGANPNDVDSSGRTPLLSAALNFQERIKRNNPNIEAFYQDASLSPDEFWKAVFDANLDPWIADKHGQTVLGVLVESEAFVLAKTLLEAAREMKLLETHNIAISLLNTLCKDRSKRALWKSNLVQIILKASKDPSRLLQCNRETPLHYCCRSIVDAFNDVSQASTNYKQSSLGEKELVDDETTTVHWTIAKQLLWYGANCTIPDANGQSCLDIAEAFPTLKQFLSSPIDIVEVPMLIPWTTVSKRYQPMLAKVARRQECENVRQYWCHQNHLASGSFGFVFAGICEKDGREVAIKRIEKLRLLRPEDKREIKNLTALADCEQVVLYLSFLEDKNFCYVVLELMEGNLDEYLDSPGFDVRESVQLCQDVVKGLTFLHSHKILHRDLKPSNILYKWHPKLCLKIADFGLSLRIDYTSTTVYGTNAGTRCWIAPEVLTSTKDQHSKASDMFSCGLVLHYILSVKKHPFSPKDCANKGEFEICNETERNVINGNKEGWDDSLSSEAANLVEQLLKSKAGKRPTAAQSLAHPLFWPKTKKVDLLIAVANQPEFECPRAKRTLPLTAVENDLKTSFGTIVKYADWNDPGYLHMPAIYTEMTGRRKAYDTHSVVELVRFIRNAFAHVSDNTRPTPIRKLLLEDFVFLQYFPNLVMEVYKAVTTHGWDQTREEITYAMKK